MFRMQSQLSGCWAKKSVLLYYFFMTMLITSACNEHDDVAEQANFVSRKAPPASSTMQDLLLREHRRQLRWADRAILEHSRLQQSERRQYGATQWRIPAPIQQEKVVRLWLNNCGITFEQLNAYMLSNNISWDAVERSGDWTYHGRLEANQILDFIENSNTQCEVSKKECPICYESKPNRDFVGCNKHECNYKVCTACSRKIPSNRCVVCQGVYPYRR